MRDRMEQALKAGNVEYVDIRIEDKVNSWVNYRGPDLDTIGSARTIGGIVRALYKGGWGYATFNDIVDLPKRVRRHVRRPDWLVVTNLSSRRPNRSWIQSKPNW